MGRKNTIPAKSSKVTLRKINGKTVRTICKLSVSDYQNRFVAPNALSIAQAYFTKYAWFRAIHAGDIPVGFVMLYDNPGRPKYFLWRLMIDKRFQGMGFGYRAMELVIKYVKTRPNARTMFTSVVQAAGGPQTFYENLGFKLTGKYYDGEAVMALKLKQ